MGFERYVKPYVASLEPYEPGKTPEALERELGISEAVKLASNENPLGPSPRALEAIHRAAADVHRYPDGRCAALRSRLARRLGVGEDQLVFGAGCDEILELLVKAFVGPGDEVVHAWPSFAMYPIVVQGMGGVPRRVALTSALEHDLGAMAAAVTERTRIVFVCNPNNPTGASVGAADFDRFAAALPESVILAVDEAYVEYARRPDLPDTLGWIARRPGTVALRTFSKIYGLAGLRVGYGVADPSLASVLDRARHPFNVNAVAEAAAVAALDDEEHVAASQRLNAEGAEGLTRALRALGIEVWPTDANFLLARTGPGAFERLLREGIIVRPLASFGLTDCVRITIGTPEQNERLVKALRRLREEAPR